MADQEKIGKPWNDDQLNSIIADYFAMLDAELSGRPYVKSRHRPGAGGAKEQAAELLAQGTSVRDT